MNWEDIRRRQDEIPLLYSTEGLDFDQKLIYRRFGHSRSYSNWLMAEYSPGEKTYFGWACLGGDAVNAEWGYVYEPELEDVGAEMDRGWIPLYFPEAKRLVLGFLERQGTKGHYDWWRHENYEGLEDLRQRTMPDVDHVRFAERVYKMRFRGGL